MITKTEDSKSAHGWRASEASFVIAGLAVVCASFQFGCNASTAAGATSAGAPGITRRDTALVHEPCDIKSASTEKIDANGDGRPDIFIVREGSHELCRATDLNFDGVIDVYSYFDQNGQLRRRESDYDRDARIDEVAIYKAGQISEKDQSTSVAQKIDTWDFYQAGTLARTERDSNGDGIIDQWWEYPKPGCPLIHSDVNGDGRPDPGATIDYCKETGYVPPERNDKAPAGPTFQQQAALPTELDPKAAAAAGASDASKAAAPTAPATPGDKKGSGK
jgi:hypothetical protein